ncbi:MAG TPA: uroporphyrinogen-III synthase [Nitrososphaeraceae archaeon]|nr:uroporphyrinogen-III synthase [Nitrososphaeraceae archaeon]
MTIAITGSRRASELAHLITSFGGRPYLAPTVGIETRQDISKEVKFFINKILEERIDYVVFMTGPGVYTLMSTAKSLGIEKKFAGALQQTTVIARSLKPKIALAKHGIKTDIIPEENTAEGLAKLFKSFNIAGKNIAILWHGLYSPLLKNEIHAVGGQVFESSTYRYSFELKESGARILEMMGFKYIPPDESKVVKLIEDMGKGLIDAITFTSPPSARDIFKIAEAYQLREPLQYYLNNEVIVVAVGPSTMKTLEENYIHVDVMPNIYKMGPMIKSLSDYLGQDDVPKKKRKSL